MKQILLFGAGKSATVLIDYLLSHAGAENWFISVVDADLNGVQKKVGTSPHARALSFDINDASARAGYIENADIVLSLLPPALHILIAKDCVRYRKNLITAS